MTGTKNGYLRSTLDNFIMCEARVIALLKDVFIQFFQYFAIVIVLFFLMHSALCKYDIDFI